MPYAAIEDIYETLSSEKQREVYDFILFLANRSKRNIPQNTPAESYSDDFFSLFGCINDPSFNEPSDMPCTDTIGELFWSIFSIHMLIAATVVANNGILVTHNVAWLIYSIFSVLISE